MMLGREEGYERIATAKEARGKEQPEFQCGVTHSICEPNVPSRNLISLLICRALGGLAFIVHAWRSRHDSIFSWNIPGFISGAGHWNLLTIGLLS